MARVRDLATKRLVPLTLSSVPTAQFRLDFFVMPPKAEASEAEIVCSKVSVDVALGSSSSARKATVRSALHSLLSQSGLVDKEEAHSAHTAAEVCLDCLPLAHSTSPAASVRGQLAGVSPLHASRPGWRRRR